MRCNAAPYEGSEPYIFISYCHQDKERVYPYLEMMAKDGYRIWYDEGITPGEEWTENIAKHLENSSVFVVFITKESLDSHNCRREINFAIQRNKNFVSLFLYDGPLSAGMEMLLSSVQGIYRSKYAIAEDFMNKLYSSAVLDQCRGAVDQEDQEKEVKIFDNTFYEEEETLTITQGIEGLPSSDMETYLLRVSTQERIYIRKTTFTIGRSRNHADYVIAGESSVSRRHATIHKIRDAYMIMDNASLNHVGINGRMIAPEVEYEMSAFDIVSLAKEHMVFFHNYSESTLRILPRYCLRDREETLQIGRLPVTRIGSLPLDQDGRGNEICLAEESVLPLHAIIIATPKGLYIADFTNSRRTLLNGRPLMFCEKSLLKAGDTLTVGERAFEVIRDI